MNLSLHESTALCPCGYKTRAKSYNQFIILIIVLGKSHLIRWVIATRANSKETKKMNKKCGINLPQGAEAQS